MRKLLLIIFLSFVFSQYSNALETITETEKLASLAKIYGFLKYYHPEVAKGKFDLDKELLERLSEVLMAPNKEALSLVYIKWIESLGEIRKCKKCDSNKDYFDKNFDLSWIQDSKVFSKNLSSKLGFIEKNRNQKENFYITTEPLGNIKVINEPIYKEMLFPNEEFRLLGLFKFWNIVEYFYPYKYLTDQDWNSVLNEMIDKFRTVRNLKEYQFALRELVAKLDDSHAWINFYNDLNYKFLPVSINNIEDRAVVSEIYNDSLALINNLKKGDIILKVNDKNIEQELEKTLAYVSGSNLNFKTNRAYNSIFRDTLDAMNLTILRDNEVLKLSAQLYNSNDFEYLRKKRRLKSKSISETIAYVNMAARFTPKEFEEIFEKFKSKKHIIIDLRAYPDFKYKMFTRYFNREDKVFALKYIPDISYPGKFTFDKDSKTGSSPRAFRGVFILLVNSNSLSLSEYTAMAFQTADNIITVGNQTAGADGTNTAVEYLGGYTTWFSGYGILYPDGRETQRKGVEIDIEVKPTINGLRQGRDEILEKAIEIANE